jgi:long-chain fatty acid transport protein
MRKHIVLALLLAPAVTLANGYDVPNVNPRDLAMGASLVAAQNDAAGTYANPASLSRLQAGLNLALAASILEIDTDWKAPSWSDIAGQSASTRFHPVPPPSLFAAYAGKIAGHGAGVGVGANIVGGGNVFWPDDWPGRGRIITVNRKVWGFYLTGGFEIIPQIRIGGGPVYYYTTEYLKQGIQPFPGSFVELSTSGGAWSYDVSGEFQPILSIPLTLGIDYKYQGRQVLDGDAHFSVPPSVSTQDQSVRHVLTYPNVLNAGVAYRVVKPLLVSFGYTWNRYVVYKDDLFQGSKGTSVMVPRHYGNGYTFRLGAEYETTERLTLRIGGERDVSGVNRKFYSPTLPDSNAWTISTGASWKLTPDLAVNGAFFYAFLDQIASQGNVALPGIYSPNAYIISLGVTYRNDFGQKR